MSKYDPLYQHLLFSGLSKLTMTFSEIEKVLGAPLPPSARKHDEWWANNPSGHTQAKAWYMASYKTDAVDVSTGSITFALDLPHGGGLMEAKQAVYAGAGVSPPQEAASQPGKRTHPLFGCLKGTTIVAPGYDLTAPTYLLFDETDASA
jgi:hypothetical protein